MTTPMKIKPLDGFSNISDVDVVSRCTNIQTSMTANPHFPDPPADLLALKTAIDTFSALIAQALDGCKKVCREEQATGSRHQDGTPSRTLRGSHRQR